jgi:hypothetical protein
MLIMQNNTTINPDEYPDAEFEPDSSVSLAAVMTNEPCCQFCSSTIILKSLDRRLTNYRLQISRYWDQFLSLPWPDRLAYKLVSYVPGQVCT